MREVPTFASIGCYEITGRGTCYSVKNPGGYPEPNVLTGTIVEIDNQTFRVKGTETFLIARPYPDSLDFSLLVEKVCCRWNHVRPCGPVPGNPPGGEPLCACGCSGYDERCGGGEWWLPMESMEDCLALNADIEAGRIYGFKGHTLDELIDLHSRPTRGNAT